MVVEKSPSELAVAEPRVTKVDLPGLKITMVT